MKIENSNGVNINHINQYLKEEYAKEYVKLYTSLQQRIDNKHVLEDVMQDMLGLFYDAQNENRIPGSIYGDTREEFCKRLLQVIPQKVEVKKREKRVKQKSNILYQAIIGLLCCGIVCLVIVNKLWLDGTIGTFKDGFQYFMNNRYYIMKYQTTSTYHEVEVDLYNLDSNKGKLIYDDGRATISIEDIKKDISGRYNVNFRARGDYNKYGGTLITPIYKNSLDAEINTYSVYQHISPDGTVYSVADSNNLSEVEELEDFMVGKLQVFINGTPYACITSNIDAYGYKEGDLFSFQLFTPEYYMNNSSLLQDDLKQQNGKVTLRLYDLVQETWERVVSNRKY